MNARQARSLLELIADLYTLAQTPEDPPPPVVDREEMVDHTNGAVKENVRSS